MQRVYVLRGLQASGKSTFAKNLIKTDSNSWKRINRDLMREMLDDSVWSAKNEKFVVKTRDFLIVEALRKGHNVIVDDTNLTPKNFDDICKLVEDTNLDVIVTEKNFLVDLEEAIVRDAARAKPVGEAVIRATYKRHGVKYDKGYNCRSKTFTKKILQAAYSFDPKLPSIVLCDLDGTLAIIGARNVYDAEKCDEVDILNEPVAETVLKYHAAGYKIVFLSGRKDTYEAATRRFIDKHLGIPYELYMRSASDSRKDSITKVELFDQHIRGKYNPFFVLDDRDQVVRVWRDLGLTCFQVADGNF